MKKHRTFENKALTERLCDEFNESKDLRNLALLALLYLEYYINEILIFYFRHPQVIIDENEVGSFKNKLAILKALGVFDELNAVVKNVTLIQGIRNHYAHNLLETDKAPEKIVSRIKQLVYLKKDGSVGKYDTPWGEHVDPIKTQLQVCATSTIGVLTKLERLLSSSGG
jgi:hypothetical protein